MAAARASRAAPYSSAVTPFTGGSAELRGRGTVGLLGRPRADQRQGLPRGAPRRAGGAQAPRRLVQPEEDLPAELRVLEAARELARDRLERPAPVEDVL